MPERTERRKIIGILSAIGTNVNCVIGLGIFTAPGTVWKTLDSPLATMILWTVGGIISIAASLSYAVLGALIERSGGEVEYFRYLGKKYLKNPKLSQLSIFVSYLFSFLIIIVIQPGTITAELQAAAQYLLYTVSNNPSELNFNGWEQGWSTLQLKLISIITLAIITGYHIPSSRVANFINVTFAGIKLVILVIIAIFGLVKLPSVLKEYPNVWSNPFDDTKGFEYFSSAFALVMFSYDGWNYLNYSLDVFEGPKTNKKIDTLDGFEDQKKNKKNNDLIISNLSSAIIITILYLLTNVAFISVVPKDLVFKTDKAIVSYFFKELFGEKVGQISSIIVTISAIGTASSLIFSGSRVIARSADLDYIPFFSDKLKWESKDKSPKNALIVQFMWCSLLIILIDDGISSDYYGSFLNFSWLSALVMYAMTGGVLIYIRYKSYKAKETGGKIYHFLNILNILILLFVVARIFGLILLIYSSFNIICLESLSNCEEYRKDETIKRVASYYIGLGYLVIGAVCYYRLRKDDDDDDDDDDMNRRLLRLIKNINRKLK